MTAAAARIRAGLAIGPVLACVGIAWTAIAPSTFSSAAVLAGLLAMFFATHRFGRLGTDTGAPEADEPVREDTSATSQAAKAEADEAERIRKEREAARAKAKAKR